MSTVAGSAGYEPTGGAVDEAFDEDGAARPAYAGVLVALEAASPAAAAEEITAGVERDGIVHGADEGEHPLVVDAVPRVFAADEWARLAVGLEQRIRALEVAGDGAAVILGREPGNIVGWELKQLARLTGWSLVGIEDLADQDGRVVLRDDGSHVDVVRRRTNEDRLRGDDGRLTDLGEVLLEPLRRGAVRVLNAFGTGVADDKRTYVYVERLVRFYCGEEPLLRSVPTFDLAVDEQRAEALDRLGELVFKPRDGAGGDGVVLGARASEDELSKLRAQIDADPVAWIAQEPVALSTHPTVIDGRLEPRHVDLRPFVVGGHVLPGGLSRFALGEGELVVNCAQGGGGKDVWVLPD